MATSALSIGEFSRATHLSAKALRFYHRVGVLEPAAIDPQNGYREYSAEQIPLAQVIRRFRSLDMPVDVIREVLAARDIEQRNVLIAQHLERMESQLEQTRQAVASLRDLFLHPDLPFAVEHRSVPATPVLIIHDTIDLADLSTWYADAFHELDRTVADSGFAIEGPRGGLWSTELFLDERGEASVFRPMDVGHRGFTEGDRVRSEILPAVELAIAVHTGPDSEVDRTYGALGEYVTTHELSVEGAVRESYLVSEFDAGSPTPVTEIGWPIFRTAS